MNPMIHVHRLPPLMSPSDHVRRAVLLLCACSLSCSAQTVAVDERLLHEFGNNLGGLDWVSDVAIGPDDSTYVVGHFNTVDGEPTGSVARFLPDGPLDPDYPAGTGYESAVTACALQDDGKLLVGGGGVFDGGDIPSLSRLTADGALDPTFDVGEGPADADGSPSIHCIAIGGADAIYVGGRFDVWDLTNEVSCLIRVRGDGSLDSSFAPQFNYPHRDMPEVNDPVIYQVSLYPDGRILASGAFRQVNGEDRDFVVRLNPDGTIDDTFQIGSGIDRGPQIAFSSSGQVRTYHNGANDRGAYARDAWLTVQLDIDLVNDHYVLSIGPRGGALTELAAEAPFRSGTIEFIDRFTVVTFTDEPSWLAYIDNVSITALP